MHKDSNES
jgi:hypothetical protein